MTGSGADFEAIVRRHAPYLGDEPLELGQALADIGIDSLRVVQLLAALEDAYDVEVPDELINDSTFATVGSLRSVIAALARTVPAEAEGVTAG